MNCNFLIDFDSLINIILVIESLLLDEFEHKAARTSTQIRFFLLAFILVTFATLLINMMPVLVCLSLAVGT